MILRQILYVNYNCSVTYCCRLAVSKAATLQLKVDKKPNKQNVRLTPRLSADLKSVECMLYQLRVCECTKNISPG